MKGQARHSALMKLSGGKLWFMYLYLKEIIFALNHPKNTLKKKIVSSSLKEKYISLKYILECTMIYVWYSAYLSIIPNIPFGKIFLSLKFDQM